MINDSQIRTLSQYIKVLEEASEQLQLMYLKKNYGGLIKVKVYMKEIQSRINALLNIVK